MRNFLSIFAITLSVTGIGVSVAREELRCWVGLSSDSCSSSERLVPFPLQSQPLAPPRREAGNLAEKKRQLEPTPTSPKAIAPEKVTKTQKETQNTPEVTSPEKDKTLTAKPEILEAIAPALEKLAPPAEKKNNKTTSQPIEVIPPPVSQPIEVIPPPASNP